jgi:hypothetical protein
MNLKTNTHKETRNYNQPIYGIRGEFALSNDVAVPYFASLLDIGRMARRVLQILLREKSKIGKFDDESLHGLEITKGRGWREGKG